MNTAPNTYAEQTQVSDTTKEQDALIELQSVELAYVGGGMGIHCWC